LETLFHVRGSLELRVKGYKIGAFPNTIII